MYRISITKIEEKEMPTRSYERITDTGGEDGGPSYGYIQGSELTKIETHILTQEKDEIDIIKIVKAINDL